MEDDVCVHVAFDCQDYGNANMSSLIDLEWSMVVLCRIE